MFIYENVNTLRQYRDFDTEKGFYIHSWERLKI